MNAPLTRPEAERAALLKEAIKQALDERADDHKAVIKEAITEWLNEKYTAFGKWSLMGIMAATLALLAYFLLIKGGWTPPR